MEVDISLPFPITSYCRSEALDPIIIHSLEPMLAFNVENEVALIDVHLNLNLSTRTFETQVYVQI